MTYEVIVDNINREEWEQYTDNFADYSIYQTWAYQQVRAEMDGQEVSRVVIKDENRDIVTMCQVRVKNVKLLGLKVGYVQWGPLFRRRDGEITCSKEALRKLCETYLGTRVNVLRIVPNICDDGMAKQLSSMLTSGGFQYVRSPEPYRTFMLRVEDCEEGIRKRLRKSFRRDLKKAEKSGIKIREGNDEEFYMVLEQLYLVSLRRKGFKGLDPKEFIRPQASLSPAEKMNIIVAYLDGNPVSALLSSNLGDTAVVLLAASNEKGLACGSSYLIWYRGAITAWREGMKRYDLGGIDPVKNPTVSQFKSRMGGQETFHIGAFEACSSARVRCIWRASEKAYNLIRS